MALEGRTEEGIIDAVMQILKGCILTSGVDVDKLPTFDIEHIFLELRKHSLGETVELSLGHLHNPECQHITKTSFDMNQIKLSRDKEINKKIMLSDEIGVVMRYPSMKTALVISQTNQASKIEGVFKFIADCIDTVFNGDDVIDMTQVSPKEMLEWVETMDSDQVKALYDFIDGMPYHSAKVAYTCQECGVHESHELKGLLDFFT